MIGWWIVIKQKAAADGGEGLLIASWETSVFGAQWLEKLVSEGKATQLSRGGYPDRYAAIASDVLPLLANGIAPTCGVDVIGDDYMMPAGWMGEVILNQENFDACLPSQTLAIDVWDMS